MVQTEKIYMQFVPRATRAMRELDDLQSWLKTQRGIKQYCAQNPAAYARAVQLLSEANRSLREAVQVFMKDQPAVIQS